MNPFAKTAAGLFVVIAPQKSKPLEAERICSALIRKLSEDPNRNLDARTWQNAVQMIPNLVETASTSRKLNATIADTDLPHALASICANAVGDRQGSGLAKPISSYLRKYGEPIAFNCLILDQSDPAEIHLFLTCLAVVEGGRPDSRAITATLLSASLNLSDEQTQSAIVQIFGRFGPPSDSQCYLRVLP
ncbi:glutamate acetyltransferase [Sinorhizobium sp. 7-81]|uniref:glutamate acetyltransferase n=1 Tax=Sinorhizobium sp. 8-89 TaxID=3049089 RepID=UPI0024C33E38|nr:glutamate acetyltransferase [Sinorhizobium sp. 8-89]MDK1494450.1 glutamate acetyltransferase [Sinorhizobium sp. 8-89]